jgi:16S rRNA processing protein RimM
MKLLSRKPNLQNNEAWTWLIGEITSPQGLHGAVRVFPHTDFPERFSDLREIGLQRNGHPVQVTEIEDVRIIGRRIVMKLAGCETIDHAEALRGVKLVVPPSWAITLEEGEYYHDQLLGIEVVTTAGEHLGPITEIIITGANDVYETQSALIPATHDMIKEINLDTKRMIVDARPGLKKNDPGD